MKAVLRKEFSLKVDELETINVVPPKEVRASIQIHGFLLAITQEETPGAFNNGMARVISTNIITGKSREYRLNLPCSISRDMIVSYSNCGVFMLDIKWNIMYQRPWAGTFAMFIGRIFMVSHGVVLVYARETGELLGRVPNTRLGITNVLAHYGDWILYTRERRYFALNYLEEGGAPKHILSIDMRGFAGKTHIYQTNWLIIRLTPKNGAAARHHVVDLKKMEWIRTLECTGEILWKGDYYVQRLEGKYVEKNLFYNLKDELIHQEGFGRFYGGLFVGLRNNSIIFKDIRRRITREVDLGENTCRNSIYLFQGEERRVKKDWAIVQKTIIGKSLLEDYAEIKLCELLVEFEPLREDSFWFLSKGRQREVILAMIVRRKTWLGYLPWELFLRVLGYL